MVFCIVHEYDALLKSNMAPSAAAFSVGQFGLNCVHKIITRKKSEIKVK